MSSSSVTGVPDATCACMHRRTRYTLTRACSHCTAPDSTEWRVQCQLRPGPAEPASLLNLSASSLCVHGVAFPFLPLPWPYAFIWRCTIATKGTRNMNCARTCTQRRNAGRSSKVPPPPPRALSLWRRHGMPTLCPLARAPCFPPSRGITVRSLWRAQHAPRGLGEPPGWRSPREGATPAAQ